MAWDKIITLVLSILSTIGFSTLAGLFWKDVHERKKKDKEHINDLKKDEQEDNLRRVIQEELLEINKKVDSIAKKTDLACDGVLSSLRNDILTCYYRCRDKGYRNDYDYQNIHDLFESYKGLHGNSFIQDVMNRFDELPTKEEFKDRRQSIDEIDEKKANKKTNKKQKKNKEGEV